MDTQALEVRPTVFTSCDPVYFRLHAPALMLSALLSGHNFGMKIINATEEDVALWKQLDAACRGFAGLGQRSLVNNFLLYGPLVTKVNPGDELRTHYACDRFLSACSVLNFTKDTAGAAVVPSLIIVDTDCLILKRFQEPKESLGLFLRQPLPGTTGWEQEGTKVAAGLVYVKNDELGHAFMAAVSATIQEGPFQWFLDQVALNRVSKTILEHSPEQLHPFGPDVLDWEFAENTTIWTGKGNRKYTHPDYLAKKNYYMKQLGAILDPQFTAQVSRG